MKKTLLANFSGGVIFNQKNNLFFRPKMCRAERSILSLNEICVIISVHLYP